MASRGLTAVGSSGTETESLDTSFISAASWDEGEAGFNKTGVCLEIPAVKWDYFSPC